MRVNIWIPDKELKKIDEKCKQLDQSRSEYMVKCSINCIGAPFNDQSPIDFLKSKEVKEHILVVEKPKKRHFSKILNEFVK